MMVGKKVALNIERPEPVNTQKRLVMEHVTCVDKEGVKTLDDAGFTAYSGEILGIAGIAGSGQKELLETIAGLQPMEGGTMPDKVSSQKYDSHGRVPHDDWLSFYHTTGGLHFQ